MNASQYPITFGYNAQDGRFYGPNGSVGLSHKGEDRSCPVGTKLIINGVHVADTGNTGASSGPHLHIGRWVNGKDTPPSGGGFSFANAKVIGTGRDTVSGNYIKLQADGALWVYLHLSQVRIANGTTLPAKQIGEPMIADTDNEYGRWQKLGNQIRGRNLSRDEFRKAAVGRSWLSAVEILSDSPEADNVLHAQNVGLVATRDKWDQQIYGLQSQVQQLRQQAEELSKRPTQAQIDSLRDGLRNCEDSAKEISDKAAAIDSGTNTPPAEKVSLFVRLLAFILNKKKA